jgi:hypothetical protein
MIIKHRGKAGRFSDLYTPADLTEIAGILKEGKDEQDVRIAIMRAKHVSEPTAYKYIRLAKEINAKQV